MGLEHDTATRVTLLRRLRDLNDAGAWNEFVDRYAPRIYGWCRRRQLQEADAADVTQDVLGRLVAAMRTFEYDPQRGSFRGWLKTVTNNLIHDLERKWSRVELAADTEALERRQKVQSSDALQELVAAIEAEAEAELLQEAHERVRLRVQPHTWQAYQRAGVEDRPAAEVARELGMRVAEVYVAKSRVLRLLRLEIEALNQSPTSRSD